MERIVKGLAKEGYHISATDLIEDSQQDDWIQEQTQHLRELQEEEKLANHGNGGDNNGMTPWQQSVENRLAQLHNDMRDITRKIDRHFLFMIGGFASMLAVMAKGFGWL